MNSFQFHITGWQKKKSFDEKWMVTQYTSIINLITYCTREMRLPKAVVEVRRETRGRWRFVTIMCLCDYDFPLGNIILAERSLTAMNLWWKHFLIMCFLFNLSVSQSFGRTLFTSYTCCSPQRWFKSIHCFPLLHWNTWADSEFVSEQSRSRRLS